jgi:hypothetical protein
MQHIKHFTDTQNSIYASVSINTDTRLLMSMWRGEVTETYQLSTVMEYCCQQMISNNLNSWLADLTALNGEFTLLSAQAQKSVLEDVSSTPLQYFALVSQLAANPVRSAVLHAFRQVKVDVRSFDHFASAIQWLILPGIGAQFSERRSLRAY